MLFKIINRHYFMDMRTWEALCPLSVPYGLLLHCVHPCYVSCKILTSVFTIVKYLLGITYLLGVTYLPCDLTSVSVPFTSSPELFSVSFVI